MILLQYDLIVIQYVSNVNSYKRSRMTIKFTEYLVHPSTQSGLITHFGRFKIEPFFRYHCNQKT